MSDGFLDRVLYFMGIQDEDEDEQEEMHQSELEPEETGPARRGRLVNFPGRSTERQETGDTGMLTAVPTAKWRMSVLEPVSFEDVQVICDHLKQRRPVIVSVEGIDKDLSRRVIDFVSGTTYAIDGQIQRVGESIFVFAPSNVVIEAYMQRQWEEDEV
jgi:cell division inhibitor SepF